MQRTGVSKWTHCASQRTLEKLPQPCSVIDMQISRANHNANYSTAEGPKINVSLFSLRSCWVWRWYLAVNCFVFKLIKKSNCFPPLFVWLFTSHLFLHCLLFTYYLFIILIVHLLIYLSAYLFAYLSALVWLIMCLFIRLLDYLFIYLFIRVAYYLLSIYICLLSFYCFLLFINSFIPPFVCLFFRSFQFLTCRLVYL